MAKKVRFEVEGRTLTENEKKVYEFVKDNGAVDYKTVAEALGISGKSASSTLARLERTHGLLQKNEPVKAVSYEVNDAE